MMNQESDFGEDPIRLLSIGFVGGPYDGHTESYYTCSTLLPKEVLWLVGADALRISSWHRTAGFTKPETNTTYVLAH